MKKLTAGNPLKLILTFALPLFVGQFLQLFYGLVDTRIVGDTLGENALAAVGATSTLNDLLIALLNGITNGFAIIIATYYGARDEEHMKKAGAGTVVLGIGAALLISIFSLLFLTPILRFLNIDSSLLTEAKAYISVILIGLVAATCYNICAAVLRAIGDSFTPLIFLVISTILNIFLDYAFILYFHMGVAGAAFATVLSQAFSAILCFLYMYNKYPELRINRRDIRPQREVYRKLLSTGISMSFMMSFVQFGTLTLQTSINTFGINTIVAHTAARKVTSIYFMPSSVLGTTLSTYCGQNLGAGKYSRIKKGLKDTLFLTWGWCIIVLLLTYTLAPTFIQLITASTEPEIIDTATLYLRFNSIFYFVPVAISLLRNSMQGFGDSKTPVFSSFLELAGKVAIAFGLAPVIGYWGIIVAEPIVWFIMVIPLIVNTIRNPIFKTEDLA